MAFQLSLRPQSLSKLRRIRPLSSSTPPDSIPDPSSAAIPDPSSAAAALASSIVDIGKHLDKPSAAADDPKRTAHSFNSLRESLRKFTDVQPPEPSFRGRDNLASGFTPPIKPDQLPSSIFGKEKSTDDAKPKAPKTEFLPMHSYEELEEKLRLLRPEVGDNWFSIAELNDQLVKLYELEEKELNSMMGGEDCRVLRESLLRFTEADLKKKAAASLGRLSAFIPKPPQNGLLEKFKMELELQKVRDKFKMSEMELELQKVRDKFKMSESDCGSTRVQEVGNKPSSQSVLNAILTDEKSTDDAKAKDPKTEFLLMYSYKKLEEKLRWIRPEVGDNWFSIAELTDQLVKLYELEEKELDSMMGGEDCCVLRESLLRVAEADLKKKAAASLDRLSAIMSKHPQDELLETFKKKLEMVQFKKKLEMKLEFQKVREEFKMSVSDCGSTRVQVVQLTTKIDHLSFVSHTHKKDKQCRKRLNELVQQRKKLLTDLFWADRISYFVLLLEIGLFDSPEYEASNYKTKP